LIWSCCECWWYGWGSGVKEVLRFKGSEGLGLIEDHRFGLDVRVTAPPALWQSRIRSGHHVREGGREVRPSIVHLSNKRTMNGSHMDDKNEWTINGRLMDRAGWWQGGGEAGACLDPLGRKGPLGGRDPRTRLWKVILRTSLFRVCPTHWHGVQHFFTSVQDTCAVSNTPSCVSNTLARCPPLLDECPAHSGECLTPASLIPKTVSKRTLGRT